MGVFRLHITVQSALMKQLVSLSSILSLWMTGNSRRQNIHTVTRQEILPAFWQLWTVKLRRSSRREDGKKESRVKWQREQRDPVWNHPAAGKSGAAASSSLTRLRGWRFASLLSMCVPVIQPVSSSAQQPPASGPPSAACLPACPLPTPYFPTSFTHSPCGFWSLSPSFKVKFTAAVHSPLLFLLLLHAPPSNAAPTSSPPLLYVPSHFKRLLGFYCFTAAVSITPPPRFRPLLNT